MNNVEEEFQKLLKDGWPKKVVHPSKPGIHVYGLFLASIQLTNIPDSSLLSTRIHWRTKLGATEEEANDPRPWVEVLALREVSEENSAVSVSK